MGKATRGKKGAAPAVPDLLRMDPLPALAISLHDSLRAADAKIPSFSYAYRPANDQQQQLFQDPQVIEALDDLDAQVAATLYGGYNATQLYTWMGNAAMVALAPPSMSTILAELTSDATKERWYKMDITPHVFAMANALYFHLRRSGVDQSIILRGESGSGKTMQSDLLLQQLCNISGNSKRDERITAASLPHKPSSMPLAAAKPPLQFNERGKLVGLKIVAFGLDRSRVLRQRLGERNFHAFYYLLAGASPEQRQEFGLNSAVFPYLSYGASVPVPGVDDVGRFAAVQDALKLVGVSRRAQHHVFKLLAAILHLGNFVAGLLEVDAAMLASALTAKTSLVGRDLVTQMLTVDKATAHRDALATALYSVLFAWIVEQMNKKLSDEDDMANLIAIVDFPANAVDSSSSSSSAKNTTSLDAADDAAKLMFAYANEQLDAFYPKPTDAEKAIKAAIKAAKTEDVFPGDFINLFRGGNGQGGSACALYHELFSESIISMEAYEKNAATVVRGHSIMRRKPSMKRSASASGSVRRNPSASSTTAGATGPRTGANPTAPDSELSIFVDHMAVLLDALENTHAKFLYCVRPNADATTAFDMKLLALVIAHVMRRTGDYTLRFTHQALVEKYGSLFDVASGDSDFRAQCEAIKRAKGLSDTEMHVGGTLAILRDDAWIYLENMLRKREHDAKRRSKRSIPNARDRPLFNPNMDARTEYSYDGDSVYSDGDFGGEGSEWGDGDSMYGESVADDMATNYEVNERNWRARNAIAGGDANAALDYKQEQDGGATGYDNNEHMEEYAMTSERKRWIRMTWCLTWWIPTAFLDCCGGMKRADIRMAWREKVAICIIIFFVCAIQLFFIIGFGRLICPRQNIFSLEELKFKNGFRDERFVAIHGAVYDLKDFVGENYHAEDMLRPFAGKDISAGFRRTPSYYCPYANNNDAFVNAPPVFNASDLDGNFIYLRHREMYERDNLNTQRAIDAKLRLNGRVKALVGWDPSDVFTLSNDGNQRVLRAMVMIKGRVYDLTNYNNAQQLYLPQDAVNAMINLKGRDMEENAAFMSLWNSQRDLRTCMNNLFLVGVVDYRKSGRCMFTNYILLAFSVLLAAVIGGKFLAALQLSSAGEPEDHEKFVITFVPCYTEGEDSLKKTIDSLSTLRYDDKRKLIFVVCDGMVQGSGNDRPTPRIVLDLLGVDPTMDPEPLSFQSLGEGLKQHNMGKVYSGLYEVNGHLVPYVVVVKVGKPSETSKRGNRGKRDSQMILMRFLNKVMFDSAMSPMELELYHQIKNVIGVNPSFYEYVLMVDADTVVMPDSLSRLVSVMPYEYFISHHLAKAFESLFGSVTCLPGCFSMYRIRSPNKNTPLLVSNQMIIDYGENMVDTLHKKNLLHLGEDRYLTTLLLKNFPQHKTVFTATAKCDTVAPDQWNVLLSQRRRWINSTVHNLVELLGIQQLCGFCCFSMRFVILIDLMATLIQPAIVAYLGYLIYLIVDTSMTGDMNNFPFISLILLATIYGLQAIIFLIKREWQHVGWMFIYILAIPVFSFWIPLYSFWKMDDFSWGQTRIVVGEGNKRKVLVQGGEEAQTFDIAMIPHKRWSEHEAEMVMGGIDGGDVLLSPAAAPGGSVLSLGAGSPGNHIMMTPMGGGPGSVDLKRSNSQHTPMPPMPVMPGNANGFPTDAEIYHEVRRILATADLMSVTKKQIRDELSALFNVDLAPRREFINQCISDILANGV
ncbi:chitin synthase-domain-containing protein [Catenaria anguillulae PL171]|uniref:chitin synthase n=1 Tax=Catenaria anguillulae PL171 TaxID=765915 RepID=A0A1Y2H684_9FUNG|nr:chitin synthase-domain-containing protein [Catenaria anguillulae PL171]